MTGPMPVRGPGQGPRGTGAGMRGPLSRTDTYGKLASQKNKPLFVLLQKYRSLFRNIQINFLPYIFCSLIRL